MANSNTRAGLRRRTVLGAGLALSANQILFSTTESTGMTPRAEMEERDWEVLAGQVHGRLTAGNWPLSDCLDKAGSKKCADFFASARNPYFLGDNPTLTQSLGWVDAWVSQPSARILEASCAQDIAVAIRFARERDIPLVIKGGGHSYKGTSNAAGSLLIWMRRMDGIILHDAFTPQGSQSDPVTAASIGAGALWGEVYRQVCAGAGRYVQGGGCLTVGVAGLIQSGGFGSLSKAFGTAAAGLLEAEIVTADGQVRVVNADQDSDLYFALRGGGGGTFGVVTRVTLRTHDMPATVGVVFGDIAARSDADYRALIDRMMQFYAEQLCNPHWGEQIAVRPDNLLRLSLMCQGLSQQEVEALWAPFWDWVGSRPDRYSVSAQMMLVLEGRQLWDPGFLKTLPGIVMTDDRPGADQDRIYWASNREESGQFLHGYASSWLPVMSLDPANRNALVDGLFEGSRHWPIGLHTNKGLAGAPELVRRHVATETATNPAVVDSFALAICGADGGPRYPGVAGFEPNYGLARRQAEQIRTAIEALKAHVGSLGSYVSESDYFEPSWATAFWGRNYERLQGVKARYDPDNVFQGHHTVMSPAWLASAAAPHSE